MWSFEYISVVMIVYEKFRCVIFFDKDKNLRCIIKNV